MAQREGDWKKIAAAAAAAIGLGQAAEASAQTRGPITGNFEREDEAQQEGVTITRLGQSPFVEIGAGDRRGEAIRRSEEAFQSLTGAGFPADLVDDAVALVQSPSNFREHQIRFVDPDQLGADETFDGMVSQGATLVESGAGSNFVHLNTERRPASELGVERWVLQGQGNTAYVLSLLEVCMNWSFKRIVLEEAPTQSEADFGPCSPVEMSDLPPDADGVMTHVVLVPAGDLNPHEEALLRTCLGRSVAEGNLSIFECPDGRCDYQAQAMALVLQQLQREQPSVYRDIRAGRLALRAIRPFAYDGDAQGQANYFRPRQPGDGEPNPLQLTQVQGSWDIHCLTVTIDGVTYRSAPFSAADLEDDGTTPRAKDESIEISLADRINYQTVPFFRMTRDNPGTAEDEFDGRYQYRLRDGRMVREQR